MQEDKVDWSMCETWATCANRENIVKNNNNRQNNNNNNETNIQKNNWKQQQTHATSSSDGSVPFFFSIFWNQYNNKKAPVSQLVIAEVNSSNLSKTDRIYRIENNINRNEALSIIQLILF